MASFNFLDSARITGKQIFEDSRTYLSRVYKRSNNFFTAASPYSQILEVMSYIGELIMFYIEDVTVEQNIYTAQQPESIYGLSRLTGHDATRGFAATGEIRFRWKPGEGDDVAGNNLIIEPNAVLQFENNGLKYFLQTNKDQFLLPKGSKQWMRANIIQGKQESQTLTGSGESFQSFNIQTGGTTDHSLVSVTINGEKWTKYESLYDMLDTSKGYVLKTGISGGLDIYFGTGNFGVIPTPGAVIEVTYIKCEGGQGNLNQSGDLTFKWVDEGRDSMEETHDLNELLIGEVTVAPFMGADAENPEFTKMMTPVSSRSYVLANPESYECGEK